MKLSLSLFTTACIFLLACRSTSKENEVTKEVNEEVTEELSSTGFLRHMVCFNMVDSISKEDQEFLIGRLKSLKKANGVKSIEVGTRAETEDKRLDENFDIVLFVTFENERAMMAYRNDSHHIGVRGEVKDLFKSPPVVIDYWID